jgi:hypothetical protein
MQSTVQEIPEEYLAAQRAAIEAVQIGRATLEETARQGEQLSHAEKLAYETQYALDKSNRLLKGMTWSGWVSNMFSKDVDAPAESLEERKVTYDEISKAGQPTAQAIQNYQANLTIFDNCETREQKQMCAMVCDNMYQVALKELSKLEQAQTDGQTQILKHQFRKDLAFLRHRQDQKQQLKISSPVGHCASPANVSTPKSALEAQQEDHLDMLASNLSELQTTAYSLSEMMGQQTKIMESLDAKSDEMYETSKTVTRRADRIVYKKSWTSAKKLFESYVTIQQLSNGRFVAVDCNGALRLVNNPSPFTIFALWKRERGMVGLANKATSKWVGQTLMGGLGCNASNFGQREEWQLDQDWNETRLLCASAGWGSGGYLLVKDNILQIGSGGIEGKAKAELFFIKVVDT